MSTLEKILSEMGKPMRHVGSENIDPTSDEGKQGNLKMASNVKEIIDPAFKKQIDAVLQSNPKLEVEVSFGYFNTAGSFIPGIFSATQFSDLLRAFKESGFSETLEDDKVEIMEAPRGEKSSTESEGAIIDEGNIRKITTRTGDVIWQKKIRRAEKFENGVWGYRITSSDEKLQDSGPDNFDPTIVRERMRYTYKPTNKNNDLYGFKFDFTRVVEKYPKNAKRKTTIKYEVEIERIGNIKNTENHKAKNLGKCIKMVLMAYQGVGSNEKELMTLKDRLYAADQHNNLFKIDIADMTKPIELGYRLFKSYWNKPLNLSINDLIEPRSEYAITLKLDGLRRFVYFDTSNTFTFAAPSDIWRKGKGSKILDGTLLDTEMYIDENTGVTTYYVFDILFYQRKDVRKYNLEKRLNLAAEAASQAQKYGVFFNNGGIESTSGHKNKTKKTPKWSEKDKAGAVKTKSGIEDQRKKQKEDELLAKTRKSMENAKIEHKEAEKKAREIMREAKKLLEEAKDLLENAESGTAKKEKSKNEAKSKKLTEDANKLIVQAKRKGKDAEKAKATMEASKKIIDEIIQERKAKNDILMDEAAKLMKDAEKMGEIVQEDDTQKSTRIVMKKFFMGSRRKKFDSDESEKDDSNTLYTRVRAAFEALDGNTELPEDKQLRYEGLIFQPGGQYKNPYTRKWKIAELLTIDFQLVRRPDSENEYSLMVVDGNKLVEFKGSRKNPLPQESRYVTVEGEYEGLNPEGLIVECNWLADGETGPGFHIFKVRLDRDMPNAMLTAKDVWDDIITPMERDVLEGDSLLAMRRFHNIVKTRMLNEEFTLGDNIMDWGSGRGGDLSKWANMGLANVFVVEPNNDNLKELKRRKKDLKDSSTAITIVRDPNNPDAPIGGQDTAILKKAVLDAGVSLSGVVAFFSLTYFGKDKTLFDEMVNSLDVLLEKGGKFIGIVMDGKRVREALESAAEAKKSKKKSKKADDEWPSIDTTSFSISQTSEFYDSIADGYNTINVNLGDDTSMVKDQEEWLFYFEAFQKALSRKGISLVKTGFLDNGDVFNILPPNSKIFSSFNRFFVFQRGESAPRNENVGVDKNNSFLNNYDMDNLSVVGVIRDNSNFIHAILRAIDAAYFSMDTEQRTQKAIRVRNALARKINPELFQTLNSGRLASAYMRKMEMENRQVEKDKIEELALLNYKEKIMDPNQFIGEQACSELVSSYLNINIIVLREDSTPNLFPGSTQCEAVHPKTIVLMTKDNMIFSLIAKRSDNTFYTVFDTKDEFIQNLMQKMCGDQDL